ncbi:MAG TPA: LysR substrate-binding domain-containing protein [Ohtaekwangia sp.]|uniref:hydrogen peroxide-inducible genes activator n=1 Tax=Ohtaekwangia sp. TaxID=2066019 RepID=UPI002F951D5A
MTVQQLKYIVTLDQERHFARAAEACFITQPALTIQLKSLEEEIGVKIFDRSKVPLKPTPVGEEIIAKAKRVLREMDGIRDLVVEKKNVLRGTLRLGVVSTLSPYLVPFFMNALEKETPRIEYTIKEASTIQLMDDLEAGELDVALMATPTGRAGLIEFPVFLEPFVAYLHTSHPQAKNDFYKLSEQDKFGLLLLNSEYCYNAQLIDICSIPKKKASLKSAYEITTIETLKNMVRANLGFAIVPWLSVMSEPKSSVIKTFKDPQPVREISLVVADTFTRKLLLEKMKSTIWNTLPDPLKNKMKYKHIKWDDSPYFLDMTNE